MPRLTRLRRISSKLSSEDYVVDLPKALTKSTRTQNATTKLQSTKQNAKKLISANVLKTPQSPVLRDRTNLSKEQATNVLKTGIKNKNTDGLKMTTGTRTQRTRVIKPTTNENTENINVSITKTKPHSRAVKREVKVVKTKKHIDSNSKSDSSIAENKRGSSFTTRVTRKSRNSDNSDTKLSTAEMRKTRTSNSRPVEHPKKIQTQKKRVSNNKTQSSPRNLNAKSKASKKVSTTPQINTKKSTKYVTRLSVNKVGNKSPNVKSGKKFFKSKLRMPLPAHSKISPLKRAILGKARQATAIKKKPNNIAAPRLSTQFRFRQTTLRESFAKQPKQTLRPRKTLKNYCEESQLGTTKIESKQKFENVNEKKGPVYKLIDDTEAKTTDKEKIYEFVFDLNDSKERAMKKRRKKVTRKRPVKKVRTATKVSETNPIACTKLPTTKKSDKPSIALPKPVTKEIVENVYKKSDSNVEMVTVEIHSPPTSISQADNDMLVNEVLESRQNTVPIHGPQIVSSIELKDKHRINLTETPIQPRSIQNGSNKLSKFHIRPSVQVETMMNTSLLSRSLSPIVKENQKENITMNSPWRVPIVNTFSRVKNVFQSTPQGKQFMRLLGKTSPITDKAQKFQNSKMNIIAEQNDENANKPLKESTEILQENTSKSPRKFGTVVSNVNNVNLSSKSFVINSSRSPRQFGTVLSNINEPSRNNSPITNEQERFALNSNQSIVYDSMNVSFPNHDKISVINEPHHDKENSLPNNDIKKSLTKKPDSLRSTALQSKNIQESVSDDTAETIGPQAGPSGIQKSNLRTDTRILRQSNLNSFLNLPDMPSSTHITTKHGIFDNDSPVTISRKREKEITTQVLNVNNAFGFDDDDDYDDDDNNTNTDTIAPLINKSILAPKQQIVFENKKSSTTACVIQQPARFFVSEIKKTLLPAKIVKDLESNKKNNAENTPANSESYSTLAKKDVIQAVRFSDTFDNMNNEEDKENVQEIPLFVDLEPVHFTQPPRFSYGHKRKRNISLNTSEDTETEEEPEGYQKRTKKKKIGKAAREQKKVLEQWAKNMNSTFEEIDHFDLVVE